MRIRLHCLPLIVLLISGLGQPLMAQDVCRYAKILSADSMEGRKPGSPGAQMAADYIRDQFASRKLQLLYDNGFQTFEVITDVTLGEDNRLTCNNLTMKLNQDWVPYSYSSSTTVNAPIVFAGYGMVIQTDSLSWDDYQGIDVTGKWVIVLRGHPELDQSGSRFQAFSSDRNKVLTAKDKGAAGIMLVSGQKMERNDQLISLNYEKNSPPAGIPVLNISRHTADVFIKPCGKSIEGLEIEIIENLLPQPQIISANAEATVSISLVKARAVNVAAMLKSSRPASKCIVVGAHYDHLGQGGRGSGSRKPDTIAVHNGADDNASGTAMMLSLATTFASRTQASDYNLVFVAFSAEEMGLLGSNWFVRNPPEGCGKIALMLNYDMVGRMGAKSGNLNIGGTGTFADAEKLLNKIADTSLFKISMQKEGYGPSDHASFYADSIPVLYFNTGAHGDYHTPEDDYRKLNCTGMQKVLQFNRNLIMELLKGNTDLSYREAGPREKTSQRTNLRVTFGIMPDVGDQEIRGVKVSAVTPGGPASLGGMLRDDIIVAINGKPVSNIYEYMERLKALVPGMPVNVDVNRGGQKIVLLLQL